MHKRIVVLSFGLIISHISFGQNVIPDDTSNNLDPVLNSKKQCYSTAADKTIISLDAKKINQMSLKELESFSAITAETRLSEHINKAWFYAKNKQIKSIYRGFFIDSLIHFKLKNTIKNLINMYHNETDDDVKNKIITATMLYYQSHVNTNEPSNDKMLLIGFYNQLLNEKMDPETTHDVIRGYVDLNTPEKILSNTNRINKQLARVDARLLLGLEIQLAHKSLALEKIYIPSLITMLRKENSSELDEMFFGMTPMFYKQLQASDSLDEIKAYMDSVRPKYTSLKPFNPEDPYFGMAAENYRVLCKEFNS